MTKRGRKSAASLSVVTALPQRMPPPGHLSDAQARLWRGIASSKRPDYFDAGTSALLEAYCRAAVSAGEISRMVDGVDLTDTADPKKLRRYSNLLGMRDRQTRLMMQLARSMRLTVQASRRADSAALRSTSPGRKPWEIGKDEGDEPA